MKTCTVVENGKVCGLKNYGKGMCSKHWQRNKKNGDPLITQKIYGQDRGNHPLYQVWRDMIARCYNSKHKSYKDYGGRNIKVCERWLDQIVGLSNFTEDMGEKPEGLTLDRTDNEGNYSCGHCEQCIKENWPKNCRWATYTQQNCNSRTKVNYTGYTGAYRYGERYYSAIKIQGKQIHLGVFKTPEEASQAYQKAKTKRDTSLKWV